MRLAGKWFVGAGSAALLGTAAALGGSAAEVRAEQPRAGVVVQMPDGTVHEACVVLPEGRVTGMDLLFAAGFDVTAEVNALGSTVCAIDGGGCSYPAEACWCRCRSLGDECTYWAYHVSDGAEWRYSTLGAVARVVADGDVDGWAWGTGQEGSGATPPFREFDQVCRADAPEGTATIPARDDPEPTEEPEVSEAGDGEWDASESAEVGAEATPAAGQQAGTAFVRGATGTRRAPSAATVEALATGLALAALEARGSAGNSGTSAGGSTGRESGPVAAMGGGAATVGPIVLVDGAATRESATHDAPSGASDSSEGLAGYAVAAILLGGLAVVSWVVRRGR